VDPVEIPWREPAAEHVARNRFEKPSNLIPSRSVLAEQDSDRVVRGSRQPELRRDLAHTSTRFGVRHLAIVEDEGGGNEARVEPRRGHRHRVRIDVEA
jgi:hypothetical protein